MLSSVTWRGWVGLAFITLVTAYLNYLLWYLVTARYDVTRSSVVTNTHFILTVIIEAAWFHQRLSGWVAIGSAFLLLGIVLATSIPLPESVTKGDAPRLTSPGGSGIGDPRVRSGTTKCRYEV